MKFFKTKNILLIISFSLFGLMSLLLITNNVNAIDYPRPINIQSTNTNYEINSGQPPAKEFCLPAEQLVVSNGDWCIPADSVKPTQNGKCQNVGTIEKQVGYEFWCLPTTETINKGGVSTIVCPPPSTPHYNKNGEVLFCVSPTAFKNCPEGRRKIDPDAVSNLNPTGYVGCGEEPTSITGEKGQYYASTTVARIALNQYSEKINLPCQEIGGGTCETGGGIAGYISRIYQFGLMLAGLTAFGAIVYGGINYILSAGNVTNQAEAKDQITQAILGLVLLLMAYLILYTINPALVSLTNPEREIVNIEKMISEATQPIWQPNTPGTKTSGANTDTETGCRLSVDPGLSFNTSTSSGNVFSHPICIGGCIDGYVKDYEGGCIKYEEALK